MSEDLGKLMKQETNLVEINEERKTQILQYLWNNDLSGNPNRVSESLAQDLAIRRWLWTQHQIAVKQFKENSESSRGLPKEKEREEISNNKTETWVVTRFHFQ